jgi:hypothetical protein
MVGNLNAVLEQLPSTAARSEALTAMYRVADDAVEAERRRDTARADARRARDEAREIQIRQIADALTRLTARIDAMEERQAQLVAADKAQRIRDALADLRGGTAQDGDDDHPTHHPGGELHELDPPQDPAGATIPPPGHHFAPDKR